MTDTFRALCAELLDWAERTSSHYYKQADVILRARAALEAQSEPVGPTPTDEELLRIAAITISPYESSGIAIGEYEPETECAIEVYGSELIAFARAALATTPPEPPTDDELDALEEKLWNKYKTIGYQGEEFMYDSSFGHALTDYRAVLKRWGQR